MPQEHAAATLDSFLRDHDYADCNAAQLLLLGDLASRAGRDDIARQSLEQLVQRGERLHVAHYRLGRIALSAGDIEAAYAHFAAGLAADETFAFNWAGAARCLHAMGRMPQAIDHAERFCRFNIRPHAREDSAALIALADHLYESGEATRATCLYRAIQAFGNAPPYSAVRLAYALIADGDHAAALDVLRPLQEASLLDRRASRALALCLSRCGEHARAIPLAEANFLARPTAAGFAAAYIDVLSRAKDPAAIADALARHTPLLSAQAIAELQARLHLLAGETGAAIEVLASSTLAYKTRLYTLCQETAYATLAAAQYQWARTCIDLLTQAAPDDSIVVVLNTDYQFRQQFWEAAGDYLDSLPPDVADRPLILVKRFEHACFMRDVALAETLWQRLETAGLPNKNAMIPRFRFLAEEGRWHELIDRAVAWLDRDFHYAHIGYVLYRAASRTRRQAALIAAIDAADPQTASPGLAELRRILAFDIAQTPEALDSLLRLPAVAADPRLYDKISIKRDIVQRALAGCPPPPAPRARRRRKRAARPRRALFLCSNRTYLCATIVALHSALRDIEAQAPDIFIVVDDDLTAPATKSVANHAARGVSITIIPASRVVDAAAKLHSAYGLFTSGHSLPSAAYYRIYFARHLQQTGDYDRAIYIDGDVLLRRPIDALFGMDLGGHPIAARPEPHRAEVRRAIALHGIEDGRYFNSGVLLFDLAHAHIAAGLDRSIQVIADPSVTLMFHDQCALNLGFRSRIAELDLRWNFTVAEDMRLADIPPDAALLHFLGRPKPWSAPYNGEAATLWFQAWSELAALIGADRALRLINESEDVLF